MIQGRGRGERIRDLLSAFDVGSGVVRLPTVSSVLDKAAGC